MAIRTVELALEHMEESGQYLERAKETWQLIPSSTKKALAVKYLQKAEGFAAEALEYSEAQQAIDGCRVIPLQAAIDALEHLEEELVRTQVLDLVDILWKRYKTLKALYLAIHTNWSLVQRVLGGIWDYLTGSSVDAVASAINELGAAIAACAGLIIEIFSAKAFIESALSVIKIRNQCIATMRRRALPQPPAKRYRRRKRAR